MAVKDQLVTDQYALYNGDCCDMMRSLPGASMDLSIYSPPFGGLYNYSSDPRDMSNCAGRDEFFEHYEYCVKEISRITKPGRFTSVHCAEIPQNGANIGALYDLPGDIIRLHERLGFDLWTRRCIWKEPLGVRRRTMARGLAHKQIVDDSTLTGVAGADYLLEFRKYGENAVPVAHPTGLHNYAGESEVPHDLQEWRGYEGKQTVNKFSHWIWRRYASSNWDDIRLGHVVPYKDSKEPDDERHVHPLQLDVIERGIVLRSNPGETVFTPFMGVGSETYGAVICGRKGVGVELKTSYYKQAVRNMAHAADHVNEDQKDLFSMAATEATV